MIRVKIPLLTVFVVIVVWLFWGRVIWSCF